MRMISSIAGASEASGGPCQSKHAHTHKDTHGSAKGFPHSHIHSLGYSFPQFRLFLLKHLRTSRDMVQLLHVPTYATPIAGASEASGGPCQSEHAHAHTKTRTAVPRVSLIHTSTPSVIHFLSSLSFFLSI